jgi:predicted SprT family Zn-dependent metalloprotease
MKEIMAGETTGGAYLPKRMVEMKMNPVMTYYMMAVSYVVSVAM